MPFELCETKHCSSATLDNSIILCELQNKHLVGIVKLKRTQISSDTVLCPKGILFFLAQTLSPMHHNTTSNI